MSVVQNYEDYTLTQAKELKKLCVKKRKIHDQMFGDLSPKKWQKLNNELSWICMEISKCEERIGYALGHLTLRELRCEYNPSGWQTYKGISEEMEKTILEK